MFEVEQIEFMNTLGLELDFSALSDDDLAQIEEVVSEKLQRAGFDEKDNITELGRMCESILDKLA